MDEICELHVFVPLLFVQRLVFLDEIRILFERSD